MTSAGLADESGGHATQNMVSTGLTDELGGTITLNMASTGLADESGGPATLNMTSTGLADESGGPATLNMASTGLADESGGPATLNMMSLTTQDVFVSKDTYHLWSTLTNKSDMQHVGSVPWEPPLDLVTFEFQNTFEKFVFGMILPVLFLISTPTNCLNMAVFYKQGLKERIHLCMFWLAVVDLLHMTEMFFRQLDSIYLLIMKAPTSTIFSLQFFVNHKLIILNGLVWLSAFIITIIACERCLCIVSPLHARHFIKTKTMAFVLFLSSIIIMGSYYLFTMKFNLAYIFDPLTNTTISRSILSKEYIENKDIIDAFEGTVFGLIVPGFCVTVVSATTVVTMFKLQKMAAWRDRSLTSSSDLMSSRDIALTRTLVFICIMFVTCYIPAVGLHNAVRIHPELRVGGLLEYSCRLLANISQLCIFINSTFSFFVYYKTSSRFRYMTRGIIRRLGKPGALFSSTNARMKLSIVST